jgi:hypothetical protein
MIQSLTDRIQRLAFRLQKLFTPQYSIEHPRLSSLGYDLFEVGDDAEGTKGG